MAGKKKSGIEGIVIVVGGLLLLIASVPKSVWIGFFVVGVIWLVVRSLKSSKPATPTAPEQVTVQLSQVSEPTVTLTIESLSGEDSFARVPATSSSSSGFSIPKAPTGHGEGVWYPSGVAVTVAGIHIPGGMVYVGTSLKTQFHENAPCLIDPTKSVSPRGDYTERQTNYWPSYSQVSPSARRAYLNWLSSGKSDPEADIGFVFLYFYGLERRALIDGSKDNKARAELPFLANEVRRLLGIYGEKSGSFQNYGSALLDWIELSSHSSALYNEPIPEFHRTWEIPAYLKLAIGQAAVAGVGLPAHVALAWVRLDPNTRLRTPATRCPDEFAKLFEAKYREAHGSGLKLPKNKTKLKLVYRPASSAFRGFGEIKLSFGETPDVTVLTGPIGQLQKIAEAATKELEPYSRYLGRSKNQSASNALEGLLQLPFMLWPQASQSVLLDVKSRIGVIEMITTQTFGDLLRPLGGEDSLSRDKVQGLARVMESQGIAMEPDVLGSAAVPKADDKVVLFALPSGEVSHRDTPAYQAALLTLQLASAVASADGEFGESETSHLQNQIQAWTHLTPGHRQRLIAHLKLLVDAPVSLTSLKKRLDPLPATSKEAIASFMATVAQADGMVSPTEVKMLEKVYKVLGVDSKKVFSDVHSAASGAAPVVAPSKETTGGFKLDQARIAALQKDTEKVSKLLAGIFTEEQVASVAAPTPVLEDSQSEPETEAEAGFLGLDAAHSSFARMLLSRPQWTRQELQDVAEDLDLMLDGALERINEASFDAHDLPLTEGEDPIEVSAEVLEKLEA
jgi:uncharacterized tellurite resistance protein B-like protein